MASKEHRNLTGLVLILVNFSSPITLENQLNIEY